MRVIDFYTGFEGEEEIILYADNLELHMWDGYFDPIMDVVFDAELERYEEAFGVVREYQTLTGWYGITAGKTLVENPEKELAMLEAVDIRKGLELHRPDMDTGYKEDIIKVYEAMLDFYRQAEGSIYIEEW
ncbi:MAG: hypothetical protein IJ379_04555 [Lachnospiraceae bacterium]|nr:hypothetical protein [Lachnospiraceae bacterium]